MRKWFNGVLYPCCKIGKYPQIYVERSMHGKYRGLEISLFEVKDESGYKISLTTKLFHVYALQGECSQLQPYLNLQ